MSLDNNTVCNESINKGGNLIRNPGFEDGSNHWSYSNVSFMYSNSFEGKGVAVLEAGNSVLYQIVPITSNNGFMLSFVVQSSASFDPGDLIVELIWLNTHKDIISNGLKFIIPSRTIGRQIYWLTYVKAIEKSVLGTRYAKITFTKNKSSVSPNDVVQLDNVVLAAV